MFCVSHFTHFVKKVMYTSSVIAAHILCLISNSAIITSSKNEKRDVKEVAKINKKISML